MRVAKSLMMVFVLAGSVAPSSGIGWVGSGSQAGVCSSSEWSSSWWRGCEARKMELLQGWIPAVAKTVPAVQI